MHRHRSYFSVQECPRGCALQWKIIQLVVWVVGSGRICETSPVDRLILRIVCDRFLSPSGTHTTAACVMDLNALLDRFHNYILPYVRGEERICGCKCGRHNIYHVIPYDGDESRVHSKSVGERVTKQEIDLMLGLLIGFCLTWCLLWLDGAVNSVLRAWRAKQRNDVDSWSWVHTFCNLKELCRWGHWRQMGDSSRNMMHIKQTLIHNCYHKPRHLLE